jgi:hypothetical protein
MSRMDQIPLETTSDDSSIRFRDCFSVRYIQSAVLLCRLGYQIEREFQESEERSQEPILRHEAFILNSVLSSVAFLESTVNELHADAAEDAYFYADEKNEALLKTIGEGWRNERNFDHAPVLSKYQKILAIAGKPPFDKNDQAFANVQNLVLIRNHLMHYKREWVVVRGSGPAGESTETTSERFEKTLKKKFAINPLATKNQPFFPDKCLGHGCAEWAAINCLIFTDTFFQRLGLPAPYDGIRDELATR